MSEERRKKTRLVDQVRLLAELGDVYRADPDWAVFLDEHDIAIPLAWLISTGMAKVTATGRTYIEEAWLDLLATIAAKDTGYVELSDLLDDWTPPHP